MNNAADVVRITVAVRRLFHRMGNAWNDLHKNLGVSARMRAVLESLDESEKTVPAIASEREVTRQHIQTIVNELLDAGLVRKVENPDHKRSSLIFLTPQGKSVLKKIVEREADLVPRIASELQHLQLGATADTLEELLCYFGSDFNKHLQHPTHRPRKRRKKS